MCVNPGSVKHYNKSARAYYYAPTSCGHCYQCIRKRKLRWQQKLAIEHSVSAHTFFGMLTYNDECYHSEVDVKELQYFIKRLRYNLNVFYPGAKLKYFLVSELGELKDRLHYHVLYMVSKEFTDTFREFEELVKLSWVKKQPLSPDQKEFRKIVLKRWKKNHPNIDLKLNEDYKSLRRWARRKYDDISLGFATAQNLKHGSGVGSINYAVKYIQKQYNRLFSSHIGFDAWRKYMVDTRQLVPTYEIPEKERIPIFADKVYHPKFVDYPHFPVRGVNYPVPSSWLRQCIGVLGTRFYSDKLIKKLRVSGVINTDIDMDKYNSFVYHEPERMAYVDVLNKRNIFNNLELNRSNLKFLDCFDFENLINEWQTITIPKRLQNFPVEVNSIYPTAIPLPLKWGS